MVSRIPNDIFQFSLPSALAAGLTTSGPTASQLPGYGDHGLGVFSAPSASDSTTTTTTTSDADTLLLLDSIPYRLSSSSNDGSCTQASPTSPLPFVQVTKFVPEYSTFVPVGFKSSSVMQIIGAGGAECGGGNSFIVFKIRGRFARVQLRGVGEPSAGVEGTVFGFVSPAWSAGVSVAGMNCAFLGRPGEEGRLEGGRVEGFETEEGAEVSWGVTGRFHLGLPRGEEWEGLELGKDAGAGA